MPNPPGLPKRWRSFLDFVRRRPVLSSALLFLAVAAAVGLHDSRGSLNPDDWRWRGDFSKFTLQASRLLVAGENPYGHAALSGQAFRYFPLNAVVYVPFTFVPLPVAQGAWCAANLLLLLWAMRGHAGLAGLVRAGFWSWLLALLVSGRFINDSFLLGQWNLPVYSLTALGLWLIVAKQRPWSGGLLVGLAAGLKYMPIAFVLYFLVKRHWHAAAAILLGVVFWVLVVPTLALGYDTHRALMLSFLRQGTEDVGAMLGGGRPVVGNSLYVLVYAYLTPCLKHTTHGLTLQINILCLPPSVAKGIALGVCAFVAAGTLAAFWRSGRHTPPTPRTVMELGMMFLIMLMVSPEVRKAQLLTTFTPAFALALLYLKSDISPTDKRLALAGVLAACALVVVSSKVAHGALRRYAVSYGSLTLMLIVLYGVLMFIYLRSRGSPQLVPHNPQSTGDGPEKGKPAGTEPTLAEP